jgi:hypothetical protein
MTISKYAKNESFGNEIFAGMDSFLKEEFPENTGLEKKAELKNTAFSNLVERLVITAATLEELESPKAEKVNKILAFIEQQLLGLEVKTEG